MVVPEQAADDFVEFCRLNPQACPKLAQTNPGNREPAELRQAPISPPIAALSRVSRRQVRLAGADGHSPIVAQTTWSRFCWAVRLRSRVLCKRQVCGAAYRPAPQRAHVSHHRHLPLGRRVYRAAGGEHAAVCSRARCEQVVAITERFPACTVPGTRRRSGGAGHCGYFAARLWRCCASLAPAKCRCFGPAASLRNWPWPPPDSDLAITHSPGCMFVTDLLDNQFEIES